MHFVTLIVVATVTKDFAQSDHPHQSRRCTRVKIKAEFLQTKMSFSCSRKADLV